MVIIFGVWVGFTSYAEHTSNPAVVAAGVHSDGRGNTEGKEVRFGDTSTALFNVSLTQTSTAPSTAPTDSFTPMGGFGPLTGMMLGEVTPGGTGSGLYTILIYAIIAVFIGGLMIGRTPEYLGKKIQAKEVKLAGLGALVMPIIVLILTAIAVSIHAGRAGPLNAGPHGFTEILYGLTSQAQQQRLGLGGPDRQHHLLQRHRRHRHAARPVRHHDPGPGPGRVAGGQERRAGLARDLPDRQRHVRRPGHRRDRDHRRPDLLPRRLARPHRRAAQPRKVLLMTTLTAQTAAAAGQPSPHGVAEARSLFDREILRQALIDAFKKLDPRVQVKNPVMFVVLVGTVVTFIEAIAHPGIFDWSITIWLFLTVIFANFAEAMAEGRGKAQADTLRRMRAETEARRLRPDGTEERVAAVGAGQGRPGGLRGRRPHPLRRRDHRGHRLGGRVGHHRRVGARSSASPAVTARRSPAGPRSSPTASWSASPRSGATPSSTA